MSSSDYLARYPYKSGLQCVTYNLVFLAQIYLRNSTIYIKGLILPSWSSFHSPSLMLAHRTCVAIGATVNNREIYLT